MPTPADIRAAHPGAYDNRTDAELQAALDAKDRAANAAPGQGYHPGLETSPTMARLRGFFSGAADAATPGKLGTAAALAAALPSGGLSFPAAALLAGGGDALAEFLRVHDDTPNAATTFPEAAGRVVRSAAGPLVAGALGAVPSLVSRAIPAVANLSPVLTSGTGGAILGGVDGYRRGGVVGALEGAAAGGVGGATLGALPRSLAALQAIASRMGPEAATAAEAPEAVSALNLGRAASAPVSAPSRAPDLMDQYTASLPTGSVPAGQPYLGDNGEVIGHTTDTNGSTGFQPIATPNAPVGRALPRDWDALFGPQTGLGQAAEMKGDVGYDPANRGASWIDSPDVSNPDLRDFMSDPANPADQRGNAVKSYRQRQQFAQSPTGQQALAGLQAAAAPSYDATTELDPATIDTMAAQGAPTVQAMTDAGQLPGPGDAMRTNNVGTWGTMTDPMALSPAQWAELSNRVNNVWQPGAP